MSRTAARVATAAAAALSLACGGGVAGARETQLRPVACPITPPPGARMDCARLTVPESRARPRGRQLGLLVLIFHSRASRPRPDPVLWLAGGPGGSAVALTTRPDLYRTAVAPYLRDRDVIVLEQRGTLFAKPALLCGTEEPDLACLARMRSQGNDLRAYTSAASADDVDALRRALRIDRWNVLGESYATRVTQTLMRDHPEHVRAAVLDSVISIPDDTIADSSAEAAGAFRRLFDACSADSRCRQAYPDLEGTLRRAFGALERRPLRVRGRAYGTRYDIELDGAQLVRWAYYGLYERAAIPLLPRAVAAALAGRVDPVWHALAANFEVGIPQLLARGVHRAVTCNEEAPFTSRARVAAVDAANPGTAALFGGDWLLDLCDDLGPYRPDPVENRPVRSSVPTLLLTGQFDPVTPPGEGRRAAATLSHSLFFELPGVGHWVNPVSSCARSIVLAFLDRPTVRPNAGCIARMPPVRWALPGQKAPA